MWCWCTRSCARANDTKIVRSRDAQCNTEAQKLMVTINCFETFPECSLQSIVPKNTIKMIGHHARLRDMTGQSYLIYVCTRANRVRYSSVQVIFYSCWKHSLLK